MNNQVNQLVIVQHELADLAREKVPPQSQFFVLDHFWKQISWLSRIKEAIHEPNWKEKKRESRSSRTEEKSPVNVVFLYKNNRRGSQTMGMAILSQLAKREKTVCYLKGTNRTAQNPRRNDLYRTKRTSCK